VADRTRVGVVGCAPEVRGRRLISRARSQRRGAAPR
jgi:hypothetical protein